MTHQEPIGERAVRLGLASKDAVASALREQHARAGAGKGLMLGSLLVEMGLLTPTQLVRVLDDSPLSGFHLGEDAVRLAAQLPRLVEKPQRTILFTSARRSQGVSTVASQVALALALMGEDRVVVVDANLRAPEMHEKFRVRRAPGLAEAVGGKTPVESCIAPTGVPGLSVMPAGAEAGDALALLISEPCERVFQGLRDRYSFVIIDVPPMLEHPEAAVVAARTDGVVVVARAGRSTRTDHQEVARALSGLGVAHLGVVLSRVPRSLSAALERAV
jgi:capsular exopolysaccharide synthesis family protein